MSGPEERADARLQETGARLVNGLQALARAVVLYEVNNDLVQRILRDLAGALDGWRAGGEGEGLRLEVLADEVFVNGRLLHVDARLYERGVLLHEALAPHGVGEFTFGPEVGLDDLAAFAADLSRLLRGAADRLASAYGGLSLGEARGSAIASFRFEPDRLAVWLYTSLLDLVDRLLAAHAEGRAPSLLPLKRTLALVIDNMREHGGIYQLLAAVQDPRKRSSRALTRTHVAVQLAGFGLYLGLPRPDILTLTLAGVLGGLSDSANPLGSVRALQAFPGLGATALPLTLLLHDARAARRGGEVSLPGAVLATVEEYVRATQATARRPGVAPDKVLAALRKGRIAWVPPEVAEAFAAWKGPWPLGTLVALVPSGTAVVVGQGEGPEGKRRPVVALVEEGGRLGRRVDLSRDRAWAVRGSLAPGAVELAIHAAGR